MNKELVHPVAGNLQATPNGHLCFNATTQAYGSNFWISDGTELGTMVKPDWENSTGSGKTTHLLNDGIVFQQKTSSNNITIYYYQPITKAYFKIRYPLNQEFKALSTFQSRKDTVYFIAQLKDSSTSDIFYFSEGDSIVHLYLEGAPYALSSANPPMPLNGFVAFQDYHSSYGTEWWVSDGNAGGAQLLKDIRPGTSSSMISDPFLIGDKLYFGANDGNNGLELWETDGTNSNTKITKELIIGNKGSFRSVHKSWQDSAIISLWNPSGEEEYYLLTPAATLTSFLTIGQNFSFATVMFFWSNSKGVLFHEQNGISKVFLSNGSPSGTAEIDQSNFPTGFKVSKVQLANDLLFLKLYKSVNEKAIVAFELNQLSIPYWYINAKGDSLTIGEEWYSTGAIVGNDLFSLEYGIDFPYELAKYTVVAGKIERIFVSPITEETQSALNYNITISGPDIYMTYIKDSTTLYHSFGNPKSTQALKTYYKASQLIQFDSVDVYILNYEDSSKLYRIQGTTVSPTPAIQLNGPHNVKCPTKIGNNLYFVEDYSIQLSDIYMYNSNTGYSKVYDFVPGENDNAWILGKWKSSLIISARDQKNGLNHIWRYDESNQQLTKLVPNYEVGPEPNYPLLFNSTGFYYRTYNSNSSGYEIRHFNLIQNQSNVLNTNPLPTSISYMIPFKEDVLWADSDLTLKRSSDATLQTTTVKEMNGDSISAASIIGSIGNHLLFIQVNPDYSRYYAHYNFEINLKTILFDSLGPLYSQPKYTDSYNRCIEKNGLLYFDAISADKNISQIWTFDSTSLITKNITGYTHPIGAGGNYSRMVGFKNDTLLFTNFDAEYGRELWSLHTGCVGAEVEISPVCQGEDFQGKAIIEAYETPIDLVYWKFSNGDSIIADEIKYNWNDTGDFTVKLIVKAGNNCELKIDNTLHSYQRSKSTFLLNSDSMCLNQNQFEVIATDPQVQKSFEWNWGDGWNSTGKSFAHEFLTEGIKTLKYQSSVNGACKDSGNFTLTVLPSPSTPTISGVINSSNRVDTFSTDYDNTLDYLWNTTQGSILNSTADSSIIVDWSGFTGNAMIGLYTKNPEGCNSDTAVHTISISPNGLFDLPVLSIKIYPNPFHDELRIISDDVVLEIVITDMTGKQVYARHFSEMDGEVVLPTSTLSKGNYILQIRGRNTQSKHLITKE